MAYVAQILEVTHKHRTNESVVLGSENDQNEQAYFTRRRIYEPGGKIHEVSGNFCMDWWQALEDQRQRVDR